MFRRIPLAVALSVSASIGLEGQSLAARVTASEGLVQVIYPSRPNACGDGQSLISNVFGSEHFYSTDNSWPGQNGWRRACVHGPARVLATVVSGEISRVRAFVGPVPATSQDVRTIGASAAEAVAWMSDVLTRGSGRVASDMMLPLILADGPEPWPMLLKIARDDHRPRDLRRNAMMWLSNGVSEHLGLSDADDGNSDDDEMRKQAIYVLSQRPKSESVPELIELARSSKHASARKTAIYWLGQTEDPRAVDVYAELLGLR
jgi:hypothetical protein